MKDRKLLIPVRCTIRKLYLQPPPPGRNDWHVRFTPPVVNGVSRVVFRSTGTKEVAAAKRSADHPVILDGRRARAEALKLRNDNATIGELIDRCQKKCAPHRTATIRSNVCSLRMIVRVVHPGEPNDKSTSVLPPDLIREFEKRQLQRAEKRATPSTHAVAIQKSEEFDRKLRPPSAIGCRSSKDEILRGNEVAGSRTVSQRDC